MKKYRVLRKDSSWEVPRYYDVDSTDDIFEAIAAAEDWGRGAIIADQEGNIIDWRAYDKALDRCFDRCNLIGEDVDIYHEMNRYKVLHEASKDLREEAYEYIACRMGFMR